MAICKRLYEEGSPLYVRRGNDVTESAVVAPPPRALSTFVRGSTPSCRVEGLKKEHEDTIV